jgi:hypothetical protein
MPDISPGLFRVVLIQCPLPRRQGCDVGVIPDPDEIAHPPVASVDRPVRRCRRRTINLGTPSIAIGVGPRQLNWFIKVAVAFRVCAAGCRSCAALRYGPTRFNLPR